jgi:hypothetical protein
MLCSLPAGSIVSLRLCAANNANLPAGQQGTGAAGQHGTDAERLFIYFFF